MITQTLQQMLDDFGPLLVLKDDIETHTALKPAAVMFPLGAYPDIREFYGMLVIRGDRFALIYEPASTA